MRCYIRSSEDWVAHCSQEWHLPLFCRDCEGKRMDELHLIVHMTGRGVGGKSGAGGETCMATGTSSSRRRLSVLS